MRFIQGILKLTRLYNLVIIALCQFLLSSNIENISYTDLLSDYRFMLMVISTLMIAAGGNVINDYYDVKIDYINKPSRVVIGKSVSRRWAMAMHAFLSYGAIGLAFMVSWKLAAADTLIIILLWWYSHTLKCTPLWGNLAVGILTAMVVLVLPMYFGNLNTNYIAFAFFALLSTVIREFVKDLEDVVGDSRFGCHTFPKAFGLKTSLRTLITFEVIFLVTLVAAITYISNDLKLYITLTVAMPTLLLIYKSNYSRKKEDFSFLSSLVKIIIIFGVFTATQL